MAFKLPFMDEDEPGAALVENAPTIAAAPSAPSASTSSATAASSSATPPTWLSNLKDSGLKADMTAIFASGTATEAQMAKVFTDLVAELGSKALSASQFANLKTIASHLASLGASAYVQYIANALVNGDAANATWTGGGAPSALGNLAAGSSANTLAELTDKWFLGSDNPASAVSMSGSATFDVTYSKNSLNLFGASGPKASDVNQGDLGDCYLLAPLAEVAMQDPSIIEQMITNNGNGTFGVRFYVDGVARYVTVDDTLPDGGTAFNSSKGGDWASLIEKAYAELPAAAVFAGEASYSNSFSGIGNGGDPSYTLLAITGASKITEFSPDGSKWLEYALNSSEGWTGTEFYASNAAALSKIAADIAVGDDVILSSYTNATNASGKDTLIADHALSVYGYDASTGMLEIRNPWGTETWQYWDTTFEVSLNTLLADGDYISVDNMGTATTVAGASVVAAAGLQSLGKVKSFSVTDSVAQVGAALTTLASETKLTSVAANGNGAGATLNLSGFGVATTVNLGVNSDQATITGSGASESIALGSPNAYGGATLGTGADKVVYTLGAGVQDITNFSAAHDVLSVNLNGGTVTQTLIGGSDWVSSASSNTQGVLLAGVTTLQTVNTSAGVATLA